MKALTKLMIELLMDCHERELQHLEPCGGVLKTNIAKGLLQRGMLDAKPYTNQNTGKMYMAFFVTPKGKAFLSKYTNEKFRD